MHNFEFTDTDVRLRGPCPLTPVECPLSPPFCPFNHLTGHAVPRCFLDSILPSIRDWDNVYDMPNDRFVTDLRMAVPGRGHSLTNGSYLVSQLSLRVSRTTLLGFGQQTISLRKVKVREVVGTKSLYDISPEALLTLGQLAKRVLQHID